MTKRTYEEQREASLEEFYSEHQIIQIRCIQSNYWRFLSSELMKLLPKDTVDEAFVEVHGLIQEALKSYKGNEMPDFGAYSQDALIDWASEAREQIESVKGEI